VRSRRTSAAPKSEKDDAADDPGRVGRGDLRRQPRAARTGRGAGRHQRQAAQLSAEHERLAATIAAQKQQLAKLLREHYVAGNEDRIKLLLSGDNPNRINRDLQMMAYVSQAQARLLDSLRANLGGRGEPGDNAERQGRTGRNRPGTAQQKSRAGKGKGRRAALLTNLSKKLVAQRKEGGNASSATSSA
jgi:septal ring factor EnvC (AmiA/AmiB activator)